MTVQNTCWDGVCVSMHFEVPEAIGLDGQQCRVACIIAKVVASGRRRQWLSDLLHIILEQRRGVT